ncbi:hypothetical protein QBC37DRAFT_460189 [Rhypophila decipiens]|uniref:Uncharacterized protein n=1 Tax=Rhypophila decipiens TaxID=261697 RepID=A0AAN6XZ17_9PEZI|nr:hypothetical protein QBC37DRAFT_460189 [Rhypophila decipiens]
METTLTKLATIKDVLKPFTDGDIPASYRYNPNEAVTSGPQSWVHPEQLRLHHLAGSSTSSESIWKNMETSVVNVATDVNDRDNAKKLLSQLKGLRHAVNVFLDAEDKSSFDLMIGSMDQAASMFCDDESLWYSLQYLVPMASLHLAALWTRCTEDFKKDLGKYDTPKSEIPTCMEWRKGKITTEKVSVGTFEAKVPEPLCNRSTITVRDQLNGWAKEFTWGIEDVSESNLKRRQANMEYKSAIFWVDCIYFEKLKDLIHPKLYWSFYRQPDASGKTDRPSYIDRWHLENLGWLDDGATSGTSMFDDWDFFGNHGPITKIILHADTVNHRVGGIEVFYGGQSSGLRGAANPNAMAIMELRPGEAFTKLDWGHEAGKPLTHLAFTKSSTGADRKLAVGPPVPVWGPWNCAHDARPAGRAEPSRLLCFCGWSSEKPGSGAIDRLWPILDTRTGLTTLGGLSIWDWCLWSRNTFFFPFIIASTRFLSSPPAIRAY